MCKTGCRRGPRNTTANSTTSLRSRMKLPRRSRRKLRVQLTGGAGQPLVVDSTNNPQAHELYLRGLTLLAARGPGLLEASDSFQQAVKLDANYAQAWGALAVTELLLPSYGLDSFEAALPRGESAAQRALSSTLTRPRPMSRLGWRTLFVATGRKPTRHSAAPLSSHPVTLKRSINMRSSSPRLDSLKRACARSSALNSSIHYRLLSALFMPAPWPP